MSNSVEVGAVERLVDIFVQDASVSTGAGLANIHATSFSSYWHRSDMTSTSSVAQTTGTLGTWSSGTWTQVNSTFMQGWYQFACPNGMFAAGSTVALHMYGRPSMAPAVKAIDITRFNFQSATVDANRVGVSSFGLPVGVSSFDLRVGVSSIDQRVGVSSFGLRVGVSSIDQRVGISSFGLPVGVSSMNAPVDVTSLYGSALVTSAAGRVDVGRVGVSSFGITVGVSSQQDKAGYGVSSLSAGVNVTSIRGETAVTTVPGYFPSHWDLELTRNRNSTVSFSSVSFSSQPVTVGSVDVSSFYGSGLVTTAAGVLGVGRVGVSSFGLPVGVSSMALGVDITSVVGVAVTGTGTSSDPWGP